MKAIVCADINWGIGKDTGMLFHCCPCALLCAGCAAVRMAGAEGSAWQEEYSADARRKLERRKCHGVPRH